MTFSDFLMVNNKKKKMIKMKSSNSIIPGGFNKKPKQLVQNLQTKKPNL